MLETLAPHVGIIRWGIFAILILTFFAVNHFRKAYKKSKSNHFVFAIFFSIALGLFLVFQYLRFTQKLGDIDSMSAQGYSFVNQGENKKGFYKNIDGFDVYIQFIHGSSHKGTGMAHTIINVFHQSPYLNLDNYFCNPTHRSEFEKSPWKGIHGPYESLTNGIVVSDCINKSLVAKLKKLPNKEFDFSSWSGQEIFIPHPQNDGSYRVYLHKDKLDKNKILNEIESFIGFYKVFSQH